MKLRAGFPQELGIYLTGEEPSDTDEQIGIIFDPKRAELMIDVMNKYFHEELE